MIKIKNIPKKFLVIAALLIALGVAGAGAYALQQRNSPDPVNDPLRPVPNLSGPTEAEKASGDTDKQQIIDDEAERNKPVSPSDGQKRSVTPTITYADHIDPKNGGQVEVGGYVNGVYEDGGSCTLTMTKAGVTKSATVQAVKGVSSVDCPVMSIPRSELSLGSWQIVVAYSSTTSQGNSVNQTLDIKE